jgi:hypothetical protein
LLAYKFLEGDRSVFTGWQWQLPEPGLPGSWLEADGELILCANGVHACTTAQLPPWLGNDLWTIELDGEIVDTGAALVAARARLLGRVAEWDPASQTRFARDCADRAAQSAGRTERLLALADAVRALAVAGRAAAAGYWSAVLAGQSASGRREGAAYDGAFAAERAVQAEWLGTELGLTR